MMKRIFVLIWAIAIALPSLADSSNSEVKINVNNSAIDIYRFSPSLELVLKKYAAQGDWYWPAAVLFKKYSQQQELDRTKITSALSVLKNDTDDKNEQEQIQLLINEINSWKLAKHTQTPVDYDLVRLHEKFNPLLEPGEYFLSLTSRPSNLRLIGLTARKESISHVGATDVSSYQQYFEPLKLADPDFVYIIQPDGRVVKANIAYWDNQHQEVAPGSTLYIPLRENLFSNISELNQEIAELARNRLP